MRYAYDAGRDVLHDVDLTVRPGERLAIVGLSGAGKSTLGRLIAGVDRPAAGTVTVGGVPIADLPPDELRRQVVLVTQEHHVFRESLRDNLMVRRAATTCCARALKTVGADWADDLDRDLGEQPAGRRAGAAARAGPGGAGRPAHGDPGRGDRAAGPDRRPDRGAGPGRGAARPHGHRDRAPAADRARRRPGRGDGRTAGSSSWAPTTSWSPPAARTPRCGAPGTARNDPDPAAAAPATAAATPVAPPAMGPAAIGPAGPAVAAAVRLGRGAGAARPDGGRRW